MGNRTAISATLVLFCAIAACSKPSTVTAPTTYPVIGTVVTAGGKPLTGGVVYFRLVADSTQSALGAITPDGAFELRTQLEDGRKLVGAVSGEYEVLILPPLEAPQGEPPITLKKTYHVETRANSLTIRLE